MHHNPSRMVRERRQASSTPSASATAIVDSASTFDSTVNLSVPTSTTVLAVIVSILAVVVLLGGGLCFYRRRRNAKKNTAPSHIIDFTSEKTRRFDVESKLDLHASVYGLEKPAAVFMPGVAAADMNPNWVPQINRGAELASNPSSSSKKSKNAKKSLRSTSGWDKTFSKFAPSERSPPPSYMANDAKKFGSPSSSPFGTSIPLPPSPPHESTLPPTPPTPPAKKKLNPFSREFPPAKTAPSELPPPIPSPARSASFAQHQSAHMSTMEKVDEETAMPRLMNVINSFIPTMEDELPIQIGDTLRLLEEYQDGWALVQRVGRIDAPSGVVPRTCITDRERVIPAYKPGRRL
ncbi:hypothetical protein R3P38DRAFT_2973894 [Favolaschia claudopus]|uniref:SH3 domain-containing protein n=1 Tax=Favolaschia claudopus TaxID=2862362 RepID=A0AAW0B0L1_9AGAR